MACSTVLAAGAACAAVVLWPGPVAAQQAAGARAATARAGVAAGPSRLGRSLTDFETQNSQAHAVASLRAAQRAAQARARARAAASARAAQQRADRLAAQRQAAASPAPAPSPTATVASGTPQQIAMSMLTSFGWSSSQFSCLDQLWERESGWNPAADNPSSGAYGIPQALPGSKMASAGPDWETSATTQIKWGLGYIQGTYGSPCAAWAHEESAGWY